jgi:hypothetical protein
MSDLPAILSPNGEPIQLFTAQDLLRSRGIENVETAENEQLAGFIDEVNSHVRSLLNEAVNAVSDELVKRLDKRGKWTLEVDGLKVTAPSPDAGTTGYDIDALRSALGKLLDAEVIDVDGAYSAIERVAPPPPQPYWKVKQAGVKALLKLPAAREAIEACRVPVDPPVRKAKVQRVR